MDFGNWSDYVSTVPPVLLIRVTPKLVEGFWAKVARGAVQTQGVSLPPLKRFKSGFARLRAFCGDAELTPIHPFKLEYRVSNSESIYEGLYAFEPDALSPVLFVASTDPSFDHWMPLRADPKTDCVAAIKAAP